MARARQGQGRRNRGIPLRHRHHHLDLQLLEPLLQDWVRLIGITATMALVEHRGGTRLSIARAAAENFDLRQLIGVRHAATLGKHYGNERHYVPKALRALRKVRDQAILIDLQSKSVPQVARLHRVCERTVHYAKAQARQPEAAPMGDLFG